MFYGKGDDDPAFGSERLIGAIHFSSITFRIRYSRLAFFCRLIFILVDEKKVRALATYITRADTREREKKDSSNRDETVLR